MSIGPTSLAASVAAGQLPQARGSELDRHRDDAAQEVAKAEAAKAAASDGAVHENSETTDRDGNGQDVWMQAGQQEQETSAEDEASRDDEPRASRDPSGECGNRLDLTG